MVWNVVNFYKPCVLKKNVYSQVVDELYHRYSVAHVGCVVQILVSLLILLLLLLFCLSVAEKSVLKSSIIMWIYTFFLVQTLFSLYTFESM